MTQGGQDEDGGFVLVDQWTVSLYAPTATGDRDIKRLRDVVQALLSQVAITIGRAIAPTGRLRLFR